MNSLYFCLSRLASVLGQTLDKVALAEACQAAESDVSVASIDSLLRRLQVKQFAWIDVHKLELFQLPVLLVSKEHVAVLRARNSKGEWIVESPSEDGSGWTETTEIDLSDSQVCQIQFAAPRTLDYEPIIGIIRSSMLSNRKRLIEIILGGVMINIVALATSLYSMQVYDRVIPSSAQETLLALTIGVFLSIFFEFAAKFVRSKLNEQLADAIDAQLAKAIYTRFLNVRLDQLPSSIGGLASQLKGYETVRSFLVSVPTQLMVDVPFVLIYTLIIVGLGGWLGLVPVVFMLIALALGIHSKLKIQVLTRKSNQASNLKMGLLVEAVEGAETIKSGQGGWRMLQQWLRTSDDARNTELDMRNLSEHTSYIIAMVHQLAYALMVAWGALLIFQGYLTMGGLIACTILSGRILGPISTMPNILVQWGHFKAALDSLSRIWNLESDHHDVEHPIILDDLKGKFQCSGVEFRYGQQPALKVASLRIEPGEKIAVLGPVGSGKTTFLRLLSGMYKPQVGAVLLDGVDISHISKPLLAESMGYLQQDGRLFAGTLRDNLLLGLVDPGGTTILDTCKLTGLHERLVGTHPKGLSLPIFEGGTGLSGGQKQLVNLTRVFLRKPKIWLLDEPTASMDRSLEIKVIQALESQLRSDDTLCLVTHKPELLRLVSRVIVVVDHQIVMDGPRDEVLRQLQGASQQPTKTSPAPSFAQARS